MDSNSVELCFRLIWILWKKACGWLEACIHWLVFSPPNFRSMILTGYTMLLSEHLWLELCLIVSLTLDFADFLSTSNGNCWLYQESFRGKDKENLKIVKMILAFSQVKKEILKVAPLDMDQGDTPAGRLGVLMMHDLYVYFSCKTKRSVPKTILYYFPCLALCPCYHLGSCRNFN